VEESRSQREPTNGRYLGQQASNLLFHINGYACGKFLSRPTQLSSEGTSMSEHHERIVKEELEVAFKRLKHMRAHGHHEEEEEQEKLLLLILIILAGIEQYVVKLDKTLIRIEKLLEKLVTSVTVVTVATDQPSYEHTKPVVITGQVTLDGQPLANTVVNLKVTDASSVDFPIPDTTTDASGNFTATWIIPPEVAPGACTVTATANGMTVTNTFISDN
jgi:hypothetical protein